MYQDDASEDTAADAATSVDVVAEPAPAPAADATPDVTTDLPAPTDAPVERPAAEHHDSREGHAFRDELARAMQAAAERERLRIEASVGDDASAHVQKVRARAAAEAGELKRLAEDDVTGIRGWAKTEIERIRGEADGQIGDRRERLELHLVQHGTIIDGEIDRVSEAVEGYRHELEVFFARLAAERDPSEIARLADTVPAPPDFELIRAIARADAVDRLSELEASGESAADAPTEAAESSVEDAADEGGRELVAVMDPNLAAKAEEAAQGEATLETGDAAEAVSAPDVDQAADADAPVAVAAESTTESPAESASDGTPAAPVADMAATAGDPATDEAETTAETPEPVGAAASSADASANPAARFIRSLTTWGSDREHDK